STTLICPNSCPRWRSAQTCLCDSPCDAHSAIAPPTFFQNHEGATPDLVPLPRRSGCRSRLRVIDHERVSSRQIPLKAQPGWLCDRGGIAYQFNALPFGLSLAPRVFTECVEAAIALLRLRGLRVYNCLGNWLVASHSEAAAVQDGHLVVAHLYRLGFVINREKNVLCPRQITHFLGMILDSS